MPAKRECPSVILTEVPRKAVKNDLLYYLNPFGPVTHTEFLDNSTAIATFEYTQDAKSLVKYGREFTMFREPVGVRYYDRSEYNAAAAPTTTQGTQKKPLSTHQPAKTHDAQVKKASTFHEQRHGDARQHQQSAAPVHQKDFSRSTTPSTQLTDFQSRPQGRGKKDVSAASTHFANEHQYNNNPTSIVVHNIPKGVETEDVESLAKKCGKIKSFSWINRTSCSVEYTTPAAASRMVNNTERHYLDNKHVHVKFLEDDSSSSATSTNSDKFFDRRQVDAIDVTYNRNQRKAQSDRAEEVAALKSAAANLKDRIRKLENYH